MPGGLSHTPNARDWAYEPAQNGTHQIGRRRPTQENFYITSDLGRD